MTTKAVTWSKTSQRWSALALASQCLLLLGACGSTPTGAAKLPFAMAGRPAGGAAGMVASLPPATAGMVGVVNNPPPTSGSPAVPPTSGKSGSSGATGSSGTSGAAGRAGTGASGSGTTDKPKTGSSCLDGITDYDKDGPFMYEAKTSGAVKLWVPKVPAGCKVPIVHMANGTGASCSSYGASLTRLASHGFLAVCYENANTGAGDQGLEALNTALTMYPDIADMKFGSTGHSQGGQASFIVLQYAEEMWGDKGTYAGLAMEPASMFGAQPTKGTWSQIYGKIKSPMFMFSGVGTDGLVSQSWVMDAYNAMAKTTETYFWAKNGATHIPVPNGEEQQISIPWFRWKLLGDKAACEYFKEIPKKDTAWVEVASQNVAPCN